MKSIDERLDKLPPFLVVHLDEWEGEKIIFYLIMRHCGETGFCYMCQREDYEKIKDLNIGNTVFTSSDVAFEVALEGMLKTLRSYGISLSRHEFILHRESLRIEFYKGYTNEDRGDIISKYMGDLDDIDIGGIVP